MKENHVEEMFINLDWNKPEKLQHKAVEFFVRYGRDYLANLIPGNGKQQWLNGVKIIEHVGYPDNRVAIPSLFFLLQDRSWPGSDESFHLIKGLKREVMVEFLELALKDAKIHNDTIWIANLKDLVRQVGIKKEEFNDQYVFSILDMAEW
jgi:hypothetical protein